MLMLPHFRAFWLPLVKHHKILISQYFNTNFQGNYVPKITFPKLERIQTCKKMENPTHWYLDVLYQSDLPLLIPPCTLHDKQRSTKLKFSPTLKWVVRLGSDTGYKSGCNRTACAQLHWSSTDTILLACEVMSPQSNAMVFKCSKVE